VHLKIASFWEELAADLEQDAARELPVGLQKSTNGQRAGLLADAIHKKNRHPGKGGGAMTDCSRGKHVSICNMRQKD
jgi:hypothetical protein